MDLSVLVATRNNSAYLEKLLDDLLVCKHPAAWELVIVDNGSQDDTAGLVRSYADRLPVIYVYEETRGKSRALNVGIKHAQGEIIVFTDDDIIPDQYWLVNHLRVMQQHPHINIVGGKITVDHTVLPAWLAASYNLRGMLVAEHDLGTQEKAYDDGSYPYGPNMAVRRSAIAGVTDPWPERLGPGHMFPVGDEMVFIHGLGHTGCDRLYTPDCIVEHRPVIRDNFFIRSVKRCFQGGYVAGYYSSPPTARKQNSVIKLSLRRVSGSRSIQELCCVASRAAGYFLGYFLRRLRTIFK